jgi:hypothetical protein
MSYLNAKLGAYLPFTARLFVDPFKSKTFIAPLKLQYLIS